MKILLHKAKIFDTNSPYHLKKKNIVIENGKITAITDDFSTDKNYTIIESPDLSVSPGWIDMQCVFGEPGFEQKETIESGLNCAAAGGFTAVAVHSNTNPPIHNRPVVEYLIKQSKDNIVDLLPVGTITHQQKGEDLAEMYDMKLGGAVAFSDYKQSIKNTHLLMRAMLYAQNINALLILHANDFYLSQHGQMNENEMSAYLGLKGIPYIAETIYLQIIIELLEYYPDVRIHIPIISCKRSVELIKQAKNKGLQITCGTGTQYLYFNDTALKDFDTNFKLMPPLRTEEDRKALIKGLINRTIDVLVSDHQPQDEESKNLEFDLADFGMINLQTAFSVANTVISEEQIVTLVDALSNQPRKILQLPENTIRENTLANITIFDPSTPFKFHSGINHSLSHNSPFFDIELKGSVIGIINKGKVHFNKLPALEKVKT
ncbi:MAG: dihydroorotase [Bacteroidia bacterium]|nr:MAG: dihydroorotase [Bacteroidia bacterium]